MSRQRVLTLCSGLIVAAVLFYFFPLFHVRVIVDARDAIQSAPQLRGNTFSPLNISDVADRFWRVQLRDAVDGAVDIEELFEAIDQDPAQARARYGRQVGLGGACFFFLHGTGHLEEVAPDHFVVKIRERARRACIRTAVIVGNAVRDSTGLIDVNRFANSQDFNNLSVELNRRVENDVIDPCRERFRVGARVIFVGCAQVGDDRDFAPFFIVPVKLQVEAPESRP